VRAFMRSFQGAQRAGISSENPHAAGAPIAFVSEREGHIGGKTFKVKLTGCFRRKGRSRQAPIISAPTSRPISIRTQPRSIRRMAFTTASAMSAHPRLATDARSGGGWDAQEIRAIARIRGAKTQAGFARAELSASSGWSTCERA